MNPFARTWITIGRSQYYAMSRLSRRLAGLRSDTVRIGRHQIPVLRGGKGPALLLVHGFNSDKENWILCARYLCRWFTVTAIDLPGFGAATAIRDEDCTARFFSDILADFIEARSEGPTSIVGHSMGGGISMRFALEHPQRVSAMILLCSTGPTLTPSPLFREFTKGTNLLAPKSRQEYRRLLRFAFQKRPLFPPPVWAYLGAETISRHEALAKKFNAWTGAEEGLGIPRELDQITVPTAVLHSERDEIVDRSTGAEIAARIPDARLIEIPRLGHMPHLERPGATARLIRNALNELHD